MIVELLFRPDGELPYLISTGPSLSTMKLMVQLSVASSSISTAEIRLKTGMELITALALLLKRL